MDDQTSIQREIDRELMAASTLTNMHGITLDSVASHRVVPPTHHAVVDSFSPSGTATLDAWIVLDECPDSSSQGYLIVFVPCEREYGLAIKSTPNPILIGCYGSFVETLNSM